MKHVLVVDSIADDVSRRRSTWSYVRSRALSGRIPVLNAVDSDLNTIDTSTSSNARKRKLEMEAVAAVDKNNSNKLSDAKQRYLARKK